MVKTRKEKREYEEPADYDMNSEGQDEFNNEPPMLSRSDSRKGKKKTIFRYPLLNLLIVFFLLIPIVIVIVFVTVQNMGSSNEVKTDTESTVNVSDNTQSKEDKEKAKKAAEEKAAEEKAAAEKAAEEKKAAEAKAEADKKKQEEDAVKAANERKEKEAAEEKAAAEKAAADKAAAEKAAQQKANESTQKKAGGSHTVKAGDTLYSIARSAYGQAGAAAGVEKIKQANGLGSNNVPVGTVLTIPQ
ncbi:LysM peptidoglycan-binding domain-containing protein [Listeria monocytogenes]|uniref:LysM peptidoglycan-binding domain-containing protein n=1 Tax=Listeria monocytogenes TaxID=1639 RepID=UPI0010B51DF6|nr:LysM peptidoglycan-binding domain-containing protein [Listeria monocytogenes]EAC3423345.1 LysM peptidoglycan-binding domain-containing protein [Listeria monocytogenes]ECB9703997.1 LysM peptidoglycan-binding domain-containing protein [Listeria monocytogenes]ECB9805364.1 LysM peptidoglycan-binding domain-containing protein [Listeria monocytogenes]EHK4065563.1 LysM peptidoglycan-binding domain-containing protein [Listeria monocytogenes]ELY8694983.1 LysM peptidoglycan-binding domain-containing 